MGLPRCETFLRPRIYWAYHQVQNPEIPNDAHIKFVCFVWISEQTGTFALYSIKRMFYITEVESVYCAVRIESLI